MTQEEIYTQLTNVFREVFQDDDLVITSATTAEDVTGWDSAAHINLMLAVETRLGVVFNTSEIDEMRTVGDLAEAIERKLN
jgi:acyl carrier protein